MILLGSVPVATISRLVFFGLFSLTLSHSNPPLIKNHVSHTHNPTEGTGKQPPPPILLIDVDNTLYCEEHCGIEAQIREAIYQFCGPLGISQEQADTWHQEYGSTVEGIRQHFPNNNTVLREFYHEVYSNINLSTLTSPLAQQTTTGYSHLSQLRILLQAIPYPMYLVSNSPTIHVQRVLRALGLHHIPWKGILTPDSIQTKEISYPTKAGHPSVFYQRIISHHPASRCILLDDSTINIERAHALCGISGIPITHDTNTLSVALAMALNHIDGDDFTFSSIHYLQSKNMVDLTAIHRPTFDAIHVQHDNGVVVIADLGAGLLNMLEVLLFGETSILRGRGIQKVYYYAYESNLQLFGACCERLHRLGFTTTPPTDDTPNAGDQIMFIHETKNITLFLCMRDFTKVPSMNNFTSPQLIVGCCFADLLEPHEMVETIHQFLQKFQKTNQTDVLLYFPITFAGTTQFIPPSAFDGDKNIPSDTLAFRLYSEALSNDHGHSLDPSKLVNAVQSCGGTLIHRGPSNWKICPNQNPYFWNTMMYFFGTVGASEVMKRKWNSVGWIQRAKKVKPTIEVSNVDLLFSLPRADANIDSHANRDACEGTTPGEDILTIHEIQFLAPYQVGIETKSFSTKDNVHLGPNQVEIESITSLISSGTELKIYKGLFDDAALDVTIDGMTDERMAYPLAYGYSLVGRVTRCGSEVVDRDHLTGRLVFCFAPHATHVICDRGSIQLVPDGIPAEDAIFMPSIETALSLVHDAHVRVGEKVAIYGQGLIGLLVTAILSINHSLLSGSFGTISAFDTIPNRLAAASVMGASEALMPSSAADAGPFDVSIEISGNYQALQSAIDYTRNSGRVIVGSWYGNSNVTLKLGIDFHRSHKSLKTSQVSEIPAELSRLWSKDRRFALTWELVKLIRPSRLITRTGTLLHAQEAYDALDKGEDIAVAFRYE